LNVLLCLGGKLIEFLDGTLICLLFRSRIHRGELEDWANVLYLKDPVADIGWAVARVESLQAHFPNAIVFLAVGLQQRL
jgi:hypothetical protein